MSRVLEDAEADTDVLFAALVVLGLLGPIARSSRPVVGRVALRAAEPLFVRLKALEVYGDSKEDEAEIAVFLAERLAAAGEPILLRERAGEMLAGCAELPEESLRLVRSLPASRESKRIRDLVKRLTGETL